MDFVKSVTEFNRIAGATEVYNEQQLSLYVGLILEELQELIESMNIDVKRLPVDQRDAYLGLIEYMNVTETLFKYNNFSGYFGEVDHKGVLDGAIDVAVVAIGAAIANGSDAVGAANEICESNMSKTVEVDGEKVMLKNEFGKIIKPETYRAPNLDPFVTKKISH